LKEKRKYTEKECVCIAKRENNKKRKYLVANRLQGKHIPSPPGETLRMFDALAWKVARAYGGEELLLVGFAETATAIGARLAAGLRCRYIQTTRENIEGVEFFFFQERHSHAVEQKLAKTDMDRVYGSVRRIVFVEDEVTTGNTILGLVSVLQKTYGRGMAFAVASLVNGMDKEAEQEYAKQGIELHCLIKVAHCGYTQKAESYKEDGVYHPFPKKEGGWSGIYQATGHMDARRLVDGAAYQAACEALYGQIRQWVWFEGKERALVLGTEEFMYPAIYVAARLEEEGCQVKCHSTTRSPIAVSAQEGYPLRERYELHSLYEDGRRTFLYDLGKYDKTLLLTDSHNKSELGLREVCSHLHSCGNREIYVVRWQG